MTTERCFPPVQPIPRVRYDFLSSEYCGIKKRRKEHSFSRNSCEALSDITKSMTSSVVPSRSLRDSVK